MHYIIEDLAQPCYYTRTLAVIYIYGALQNIIPLLHFFKEFKSFYTWQLLHHTNNIIYTIYKHQSNAVTQSDPRVAIHLYVYVVCTALQPHGPPVCVDC